MEPELHAEKVLGLSRIEVVTLVDALHAFFGKLPRYMIDDARYEAGAALLTRLGRPTEADDLRPTVVFSERIP